MTHSSRGINDGFGQSTLAASQAFGRAPGKWKQHSGRKRFQYQKQGRCYICGRYGHFARSCWQHPKRRPPVGKEVHLLAESRAPTLSAISSCSVSDSAGVKEGVGRNSLLSMQGLISGLPAVILIDCGASHNFISRSWVERHELKTEQLSTPLGVKLADSGPLRQVDFRTEVLPISVAPCSFSQSFVAIDMDGFDALLGKEWLSDCNPQIDFVTHHVQLQNGSYC